MISATCVALKSEQRVLRRRVAELQDVLKLREAEVSALRSSATAEDVDTMLSGWDNFDVIQSESAWEEDVLGSLLYSGAQLKERGMAQEKERKIRLRQALDLDGVESDDDEDGRRDSLFDRSAASLGIGGAAAAADEERALAASEEDPASTVCYTSFVTALRRDESSALVGAIKRFVLYCSAFGADASERSASPPGQPAGTSSHGHRTAAPRAALKDPSPVSLHRKTRGFLRMMEDAIMTTPKWAEWRVNTPMADSRKIVRESLERLLMTKCGHALFRRIDARCEARNSALLAQMDALAHLTPSDLDVPAECCCNELVFAIAADELRRLTHETPLPRDKLCCIVKVADCIFRSLNLQMQNTSNGADEFLPILVYVVLQSRVKSLFSHLEYIEKFRHPEELRSREGYIFVSLQSAVAFIECASADDYR